MSSGIRLGLEITLVPRQQVSLVATSPERRLNVTSMGSGFVQLMWVLAMIEISRTGTDGVHPVTPAIGIEEPEPHLHPALQLQVAAYSRTSSASAFRSCARPSPSTCWRHPDARPVRPAGARPGRDLLSLRGPGRAPGGERTRPGGRGFARPFEANEDELKRYLDLLSRR